jgi:heme/copper-type cytochrome/quinol oxidase subunit 3
MSTVQELRKQRWERTMQAGMPHFVLTRGLVFALVFGVTAYLVAPPPMPWFASGPLFCLSGLVWAAFMWLFLSWSYKRARKNGA